MFNPKGCANKSRSCCIYVNHSNYIPSEGGRGEEETNDKDIGTLINTATRLIPMGIDCCVFLVITTQIKVGSCSMHYIPGVPITSQFIF